MLDYARSDTHYLLYIYDHLRNALLDRGASSSRSASRSGSPAASAPTTSATAAADPTDPYALLREALARSNTTSLRTHLREVYDPQGAGPGGWDTLARKWNKGALMADSDALLGGSIAKMQRNVYRAVHGWRDKVAREEDESTRYVVGLYVLEHEREADEKLIDMCCPITISSNSPSARRRMPPRFWRSSVRCHPWCDAVRKSCSTLFGRRYGRHWARVALRNL
jgi:exosome complex exonuclease RRP6